jgi:hypothetical protein
MQLRMFQSKILQFKITMWLHSGHNNSSPDHSLLDTTTVEISLVDKDHLKAIPATGKIKPRVPMLPETVNFVFTARLWTIHKMSAAKE